MKEVTIYTDGGCHPNPGVGGYGALLIINGKVHQELYGGFRKTTNNRMELFASIMALEVLKEPCRVKLYSDSKYLIEPFNSEWIDGWKTREFKKVKNPDLWKRLLAQYERHKIDFIWVKGHANNTHNERCDILASIGINKHDLIDENFENGISQNIFIKTENIKNLEKTKKKENLIKKGDFCKKCMYPLIVRKTKPKKLENIKHYYYEYYFWCRKCQTLYHTDDAKRYPKNP